MLGGRRGGMTHFGVRGDEVFVGGNVGDREGKERFCAEGVAEVGSSVGEGKVRVREEGEVRKEGIDLL